MCNVLCLFFFDLRILITPLVTSNSLFHLINLFSNILSVSILYPWLMTTVLNVSSLIYFDNDGFDVECQGWPVVILLIGSTLARSTNWLDVGPTLQCLISNGFPTNIQRSNTVHWLARRLPRRYVWSLGRRQINIIQHLSCITTKQTITLFVTFSVHTNVRVY